MRSSSGTIDPARASDAVRRLNPEVFGPKAHPAPAADPSFAHAPFGVPDAIPASRARVARRGSPRLVLDGASRLSRCNKTEGRFALYLEALYRQRPHALLVQPPRLLELPGGGTYTPDFLVVTPEGAVAYEVKGGYRGPGWEQGYERFKRAAAHWASGVLSFALATWDRREGRWTLEPWPGNVDKS